MHLGFSLSLHARKTVKVKLSTLPPTNINTSSNEKDTKEVNKPKQK